MFYSDDVLVDVIEEVSTQGEIVIARGATNKKMTSVLYRDHLFLFVT